MRKIMMMVVIGVVVMTGISFGAVVEDFEDGDLTSNPTWVLDTDVGDGYITSDPVRPNNLVYTGYGDSSDHRWFVNYLDTSIQWTNFDISMEFLAIDGSFDYMYVLENNSYEFAVRVNTGNLRIYENGERDLATIPTDTFRLNEWYKFHSWYDSDTGLVRVDLREVENNTLLIERSILPMETEYGNLTIDRAYWGVRYTPWQYVDNFVLTPEPTTLVLFALGGLFLRKRKS